MSMSATVASYDNTYTSVCTNKMYILCAREREREQVNPFNVFTFTSHLLLFFFFVFVERFYVLDAL